MSYLFFSPHLDDVILSCGGLIAKLCSQKKKVSVVTLFTGIPTDLQYSKLAQDFHTDCKLHASSIVQRKQEDLTASKILGFSIRHLDFLDCIYRKKNDSFLYTTKCDVFSGKINDPMEYLLGIEHKIRLLNIKLQEKIFLPLALGNHIDHLITRKIIEKISSFWETSHKLYFYEDLPYSFDLKINLTTYLKEEFNYTLEKMNINQFKQKINAIEAYQSQFQMFWNSTLKAEKDFIRYSKKIFNESEVYYERYWYKKS